MRTSAVLAISIPTELTTRADGRYARPGGNLTGVAGLSPELAGKRLELLRELVPSLFKIGILRSPANTSEVVASGGHPGACARPWNVSAY